MPNNISAFLERGDVAPSRTLSEAMSTAAAFTVLVLVDGTVRFLGFKSLHKLLRRVPKLRRRAADSDAAHRICAAVDRAAVYYFKRAWCLQRSAATVCCLRLFGFPAELVIGVRKMPFYAHAWVEMDGTVLNDGDLVRQYYAVIERC